MCPRWTLLLTVEQKEPDAECYMLTCRVWAHRDGGGFFLVEKITCDFIATQNINQL